MNVQHNFKYLGFISSAIVATLIISNVAAIKLVQLDLGRTTLITSGGVLIFPLTYIFGDVLTEVYGYGASRRVIYTAFFWMAVGALMFWLVIEVPPAPFYEDQESFAAILGRTPRIVVASLTGFFVGEFVNSYVMAKMKIWTGGSQLWTRTIGSTIFGQGTDTIVFFVIAFYGITPNAGLIESIWDSFWIKVAIEVLFTPLTYQIVNWLKQKEGVDHFDSETNFNPFALRELFR